MTESSTGAEAEARPVRASALAREAFAQVRADMAMLWPFGLLIAAASGGVLMLGPATQGEINNRLVSLWPQRLGYDLFASFAPGLAAGLAIRAMLGRRSRWAIDGPFLIFIALYGASTFVTFLFADLFEVTSRIFPPLTALPLLLAGVVLMFVVLWVYARLILWPVGRLMGDEAFSAARSWQLMRGAVGAYILGLILVVAAPVIVGAVIYSPYRHDGALWRIVAAAPVQGLAGLLSSALTAVLYRRRTGGGA